MKTTTFGIHRKWIVGVVGVLGAVASSLSLAFPFVIKLLPGATHIASTIRENNAFASHPALTATSPAAYSGFAAATGLKGLAATVKLGNETMPINVAERRGLIRFTDSSIENLDPEKRSMTVTGSNTPVLRGGSGELFHDPSFLAFIEVLSKKHAADNLRDMGYGREGENAAALTQSLLRFQLDFGIPRTGILDGVSMGTLNAVRSNREFLQSCEAASGEHYRTVHVTRTVDPGSSTFYRVQALGFKPLLVDTPTQIVDAIRNTRRGGPETVYMVVAGPAPERDVQALRWSLELLASKVPIVLTEDEHAAVGSLSLQQQLLLPNQGRRTFTAIGPLAVHSLGLPERTFQLKSGNGVLRLKVTGIWRESVDQLIAIFQWLFNRNSGLDSLSTAAILQEGLKAFAEKTQTDPHRLGVWVYAETTGAQVAVREAEEPRTGILTSCGLGCVCGCPKVDSRPAIRQLGSRASSDSGKPQ